MRKILLFLTIGIGTLSMTVPAHAQQTVYAIANGGTTLIRFQTNNPGAATAVGNFNGGATFLDAIDFRPLNGQLYGYLDATDTLYSVDLNTATLTVVSNTGTGTNTNLLGMDFNPLIDRVRVVTDSTQNLVYNPNTNAAPTVATSLFYKTGDVNEFSNALIIDNAYSKNVAGAFATSTQYAIDYGLGILTTLNNNLGELTTIGSLGVSINKSAPYVGFDIFTTLTGIDTAYAVLDTTAGNAPSLYTINLATGLASSVGTVGGGFNQVYSLAVTPSVAPEPGTLFLVGLGLTVLIAPRRRSVSSGHK